MSKRRWRYVDAVLAADFDRDGHFDIATPGNGGASVRRGRGDGTLLALRTGAPRPYGLITQGGAVADFNGDGRPDVAVNEACAGAECAEFEPDRAFVYLNWSGQPAPPCVVPPVEWTDLRLPGVRRVRRRAGCRVGHVRYRYSRRVSKGRVIDQSPEHDVVLDSHGRVDLVVSSGGRR
jgi:hypothetical protein